MLECQDPGGPGYSDVMDGTSSGRGATSPGRIRSVGEFKVQLQDVFDNNEESIQRFGETRRVQLKTYLVESTLPPGKIPALLEDWSPLDSRGWYVTSPAGENGFFVLDATGSRVWRVFSLFGASQSDAAIEKWVGLNRGLDYCWLQRGQLTMWGKREGWRERGVGIRFDDGLAPLETQGYFSLKAWHGAGRRLPGLDNLVEEARGSFAIYSVRWEKVSPAGGAELIECYSDGKITVNRADNVDEVLHFSSELAEHYQSSLLGAERQRDKRLVPFELDFSQKIDLNAFSETVRVGKGPMSLWLSETSHEEDFRQFRGVDLHTGDKILVDMGYDYAYLSVPSPGCVNAAPRLAVVQGEDNAGRTAIVQDGVEVFG